MMSWQFPPFMLYLVLSGIISAALAYFVWQRHRPGTTAFALLMLAVTEWSLAYALSLMSSALPVALFWDKIVYLGTVVIGPAWLAFALQYTGRGKWLTGRNIVLLAVVPLVTLALVWTNKAHSLIYTWTGFEAVGSFRVLNVIYGPWFWFHIAYTYILLLLGTILLFRTLFGSSMPRLYRGQFIVVLIGVLAPWVTSVLDLVELGLFSIPLDLAPFACTITGLTVTWGLFSFRLLDIVPVARDAVVDGIRDGMIVLDLRGRVIDLNPAAQDLIRAAIVQAIGQQVGQILPFWSEISERCQEATETQVEVIWNRDGKQYHYNLRISPLTDRRGRLTGQLILLHDITQRVQAETQIRQLKEFNEGIVQNMTEGIVMENAEGHFTFVNPAAAVMLGYLPEELTGLHWTDIIPPDQHPIVEAADQRRMRGESDRYELELARKDGRRISVLVGGSPRFEGGCFIGTMAVFADITERKRAEEALRESEARLRTLIDHLPAEVWAMDGNLTYITQNAASSRIVGNVVGKRIEDLPVLPDVKTGWLEQDKQVLDGKIIYDEYQIEVEGAHRDYENIVAPVKVNDAIIGLVGVALDVTERKQAEEELRKYRDHLAELVDERTSALAIINQELEAFSYSVAHDLRSPLRHIDGYIELLQENIATTLDEQSQHYMVSIADAAKKMGMLIDGLLDFSRLGRREILKRQVDLGRLVQDVIQEHASKMEGREIHWQITELPVVLGDSIMLRIVLNNLLSNALKFTRPRQEAKIEIGCKLDSGAEVEIFVRDNGVGFDMTYADKLFGVFQRLHHVNEFEGTGIGLANVRNIISRHGGHTWAEGEVDGGATFYFSLPTTGKGA